MSKRLDMIPTMVVGFVPIFISGWQSAVLIKYISGFFLIGPNSWVGYLFLGLICLLMHPVPAVNSLEALPEREPVSRLHRPTGIYTKQPSLALTVKILNHYFRPTFLLALPFSLAFVTAGLG
jgi:hypothetical protein